MLKKRILSLLLSLTMIFGISVPLMASEVYIIQEYDDVMTIAIVPDPETPVELTAVPESELISKRGPVCCPNRILYQGAMFQDHTFNIETGICLNVQTTYFVVCLYCKTIDHQYTQTSGGCGARHN